MTTEIEYRGYEITFKCGYYWLPDWHTPYANLSQAKDLIDFWLDEELMYVND